VLEKDLKDNIHDILHLALKYAQVLIKGHYLFLEARGLRSRKTVRFSEQLMSTGKYQNKSKCPILIFTSGNYTNGEYKEKMRLYFVAHYFVVS